MVNKKYQFFISSTCEDLRNERKKVCDTILCMNQIPISMETFSGEDRQQWSIIQEHIDDSDFFILLIGERYGTLMETGYSYTETEYDYAVSMKKTILVFMLDEKLQDKARMDNPIKLESFMKKASNGRMRSSWSNVDDLGAKIALSVYQVLSHTLTGGWIKYNAAKEIIESFTFEALKNIRSDIYIVENTLINYYNYITKLKILAENGIKIYLMLLDDGYSLKRNCDVLGATDYNRMRLSIQTMNARIKGTLGEYIGINVFVKKTTDPIWITQIGYDIMTENSTIWSTHLLYDVNPLDCLQVKTTPQTEYHEFYKKHLLHSWNNAVPYSIKL